MTSLQQKSLASVARAWALGGHWYRAGADGRHPRAEAVTLASLFRSGQISRRAWRGKNGAPDAAYEYRPKMPGERVAPEAGGG
jgi:hypothetical protein